MEITLYLDVIFAVNFSVDLILLLMLRRILKLKGMWIRLAAGSAALEDAATVVAGAA